MNLHTERKKTFFSALSRDYSAAVFDIDGTLAEKNAKSFSDDLLDELSVLSERVPLAVCTGRAIDDVLDRLNGIFAKCKNVSSCKRNWFALCENGCVGYVCEDGESFLEFYRVEFPYSGNEREALFRKISEKMKVEGGLGLGFQNLESMIFRPNLPSELSLEECSKTLYDIASEIIESDADYNKKLIVVDAGMGVAVISREGNKDKGVKEMAKYLRENRGMKLASNAPEILVVGDQGGKGGNDETLLNGEFGTPFSVGKINPERLYPLPVFDGDTVLEGPKGTLNLLRRIKFNGIV